MFVDSHCHLNCLNLEPYNGDLAGAVKAANEAQVSHILCVAVDMEGMESVIDTTRFDGVFASSGVHPLEKESRRAEESELLSWARHPKVIAIGETGLDYHYDKTDQSRQREQFALQLAVAKNTQLPVIIHTREAKEDTVSIMRQHACKEAAGVMHCFTETWDMARQALDMNFYISFSGIVTFKNATALQEVAKKIPLDRILIETDSPYLAPVPYRGKSNEPRYVPEVARFLSQLRGEDIEEFAAATTANFFSLFSKAQN